MFPVRPLNSRAQAFKTLHKPGNPVVLTNVWSLASANLIASLPQTKALATASFGVARELGVNDDDLTYEQNLTAIRVIAKVALKHALPMTADFQDGYGARLKEGIEELIDVGVVGVNLEDYVAGRLQCDTIEQAAARIKVVLDHAKACGVPDFVVNARTDVLVHGGSIEEVIERGNAYLAAGATTVFVWGRQRGLHDGEIVRLVEAFGGRLNVSWKPDGLGVRQLREMGVARISLGPKLMLFGEQAVKKEVERLLEA